MTGARIKLRLVVLISLPTSFIHGFNKVVVPTVVRGIQFFGANVGVYPYIFR